MDGSVDDALTYLESDPWEFRSGYRKAALFRQLKNADLSRADEDRLRQVLLHHVDVGPRWEFRDACGLARRIGGDDLRSQLLARLHASDDLGVSVRALTMLVRMRRPRLSAVDLARGRAVLLRYAGSDKQDADRGVSVLHRYRGSEDGWTGGFAIGPLRRLWTPVWGRELLALAEGSDESDLAVGARRLLHRWSTMAERLRGTSP